MTDNIPAIHEHEGRLNGIFELPPADMPYIKYQGRVMLVLLADAVKISIGDTKDGTTKAAWVFKAVDAAVVREESMREHLANSLYLDDEEEPTRNFVADVPLTREGTQMEGRYDEEGGFLGFEKVVDTETGETLDSDDEEEEEEDGGEIVVDRVETPRPPLFKRPTPAVVPQYNNGNAPGEIETYGEPVRYKDKTLAGFLSGEGSE